MTKKSFCALLWALVAGISFTVEGRAQGDFGFKVDVRLVEVYATVFDHKGQYVDGLGRDKFEIYDEGKPQKIASFETEGGALSCAIMLDTSGSMAKALPLVKNSIVKFIEGLDPRDSVAVYGFNERLVARQEYTTDKDMAKRAVLRTRAEGGTALFDALAEVSLEASAREGKNAIILFTDGDDNLSILTVDSAIMRARKLGIPLYAIATGEALQSKSLLQVLDKLSERTGGLSYQVKESKDLNKIFLEIAEDLNHLYMIGYHAPPAGSAENWRKIDIDVKGLNKCRIRAKEGYYPN
jgi:Ca-activated chloride channel family protein